MIDIVHTIGTQLPRSVARFYPDILWRTPTRSKTVYFTFDDGPTPSGASQLLDILARYNARASFFLLGQCAEDNPGLVRALAEAGHTIGNHTYSHPNAWKTTETTLLDELERTTGLLEDLIQEPLRWMRPPFGFFTHPMRAWCQLRRQHLTMWDVGVGDFLPMVTRQQIERRTLKGIRPGSIVVLHDNLNTTQITPPAFANILARLHGEGWHFAAL